VLPPRHACTEDHSPLLSAQWKMPSRAFTDVGL
jgi:hypothetical protein